MQQIESPTWGGRSSFRYCERNGRVLFFYGDGGKLPVPNDTLDRLLTNFAGQTVSAGTSRTDPPVGSLGAWLARETRPGMVSYIAEYLVRRGFARHAGRGRIEIFKVD
jgi:hypothetical protein